jgi:hypothetical protein
MEASITSPVKSLLGVILLAASPDLRKLCPFLFPAPQTPYLAGMPEGSTAPPDQAPYPYSISDRGWRANYCH